MHGGDERGWSAEGREEEHRALTLDQGIPCSTRHPDVHLDLATRCLLLDERRRVLGARAALVLVLSAGWSEPQ